VAGWFLVAAHLARAQEIQVPSYVVAQVLGRAPETVPAAPHAQVTRVAQRIQQQFQDQLVAGVRRPRVELEVHFGWDSDVIDAQSEPQIEAAAEVLNQDFPAIRFRVAGYADPSGDAVYNQKLSERRAQAVWRALVVEHGVDADRIERIGYGEDDPDGNAPDAERRRVELQILRAGVSGGEAR
jgi:outer membrane protein OmpA-like peptidoglycan-associated protein